mmetsp:Transcript_23436/g.93038  ORF Transcript_23436/g.93038 Transcript_23436/m.93038 type:complete len:82 (-) Transcript_23436:145-390(-)
MPDLRIPETFFLDMEAFSIAQTATFSLHPLCTFLWLSDSLSLLELQGPFNSSMNVACSNDPGENARKYRDLERSRFHGYWS